MPEPHADGYNPRVHTPVAREVLDGLMTAGDTPSTLQRTMSAATTQTQRATALAEAIKAELKRRGIELPKSVDLPEKANSTLALIRSKVEKLAPGSKGKIDDDLLSALKGLSPEQRQKIIKGAATGGAGLLGVAGAAQISSGHHSASQSRGEDGRFQ